jgi:flagellar basal body L-ring protein FlgH
MTRTRIHATLAALSALLLVTACAHEARRGDAGASAKSNTAASATTNANATPNANSNSTTTANATPNSNSNSMTTANATPNSTADATPNSNSTATATAKASGPAAAPLSGEIAGRVEQVDPADHFVIAGSEQSGLGFDHFKADERTEVTIGGKKASLAEVQPGDEVRASYSGQGDALHVDKLQVTPRAGADGQAAAKSDDEKK